jgi:hypothetical protein
MKHNLLGILIALAVSLSISVPSTYAQSVTTATVPFAFMVGRSEMPAGNYTIRPIAQSVILIRERNTAKGVFAQFRSEQAGKSDGSPKLVFHKYANKYFLSRVSRGYGSDVMDLPPSKLEKEMRVARTHGVPDQKAVIAAKSSLRQRPGANSSGSRLDL